MRRKPRFSSDYKILDLILTGLLLPPYLLKKIGDWIIFLIKKIDYFLDLTPIDTAKKFWIIIYPWIQKLSTSSKSISHQGIIFGKKLIKIPKSPNFKTPTFKLPQFPALRPPPIKLTLPKLPPLPKLTLPKFPTIIKPRLLVKIKYFTIGILVAVIFIFIPYNLYSFLAQLPNPQALSLRDIPVTTKIFDREGRLLYEIYADQNRTPVDLKDVPKIVKEATIAIEDKDFYRHQGISLKAITRALYFDFKDNSTQGGSTITQQLIKSALLTPERTVTRKVKEIILAFWAEHIYTKDQILEMYLNQISYGGTAWGIEAASETYFGKNVKDLTLAQSALLAGLPASPTFYSPFGAHPEYAKTREKAVLQRMVEDGYISQKDADNALNEELKFKPLATNIKAPHFVMYVKQLLADKYGERMVEKGGLRVTTSLDLTTQTMAEKVVKTNLESLKTLNVGNGAALITDPKTGQIFALVGSKDYFDTQNDGNVNVALSLRQPGSSIKVVNYSAALQKGYTAASILDDSPITYHVAGQPDYSPINYDGRFHGRLPLRNALANSYNVPAVKVLSSIGIKTMIDQGKKMGITTWEDESRFGLSLTLGGGDVTMLDMAKVYGTLANSGLKTDLLPILKVTDYKGNVLEEQIKGETAPAVPPGVVYILSDILSDNNARAWAFGPNSTLVIPGKTVSVKTGTSNDKRDNWTIGFTPSYVVTVWVGNNDNSPMNPILTSGITGASPIWHDIMVNLLNGKSNETFTKPDDVVSLPCYGHTEYFVRGTEPKGGCQPLPTPTPTPK